MILKGDLYKDEGDQKERKHPQCSYKLPPAAQIPEEKYKSLIDFFIFIFMEMFSNKRNHDWDED